MRFTLVCHGEVEDGAPGLAETGHDDPPLTAFGRRQAAALAGELNDAIERGTTFEALLTSPLRAARMTSEAIAAVLDVDVPRVADELATLTPEVIPADGAETLEPLQERAWSLLESLKEQHDAQAAFVLVTHELPIRALVCRALSMPLSEMQRFALEPASLTTIEFRQQANRERIILANLNETCHLEQAAR